MGWRHNIADQGNGAWAKRGLTLMSEESEAHRARLKELAGFLRFVDEEYPAFLERFDAWWANQEETL